MKFFIDTANVDDIRKANDMGVICGVTTNPSLIAKEGRDFTEVIKEITSIADIFDIYGYETKIIAASVRNPIHVTDCALAGADIATVPYKVIEQMTKHPLTDQGIEKFQADYRAVFGD